MSRMTERNLHNIKCRFEEKTGVSLKPDRRAGRAPAGKLLVLAAAVAMCLALAAFTYPLFSGLDGDELSLQGTYEGNGIVSVHVENRSDKKLSFQKQTRLMRWVTAEEVPGLGGEVLFENTDFAPHSDGIMTLDLSRAYDVRALEESDTNAEWFYLVLTNNNFLFGQDWMCSVNFGPVEPEDASGVEKTVPSQPVQPQIMAQIEQELRFYFEESYSDTLMAFNEANFQYQQKVEELLARFPGTVVPALSPRIMVGGPTEFLEPEPVMGKIPEGIVFDETVPEEQQYLLTFAQWGYTDALGRMVATSDEKAWTQIAMLPQYPGQTDGGVALPLVFLFVYDADAAMPENYTFIYGQLHSFADLEAYKVLADEYYAIYDATSLIYTDVDAYLDDFLAANLDVYCDDQIRRRVRNIYGFYQEKQNITDLFGYLAVPES